MKKQTEHDKENGLISKQNIQNNHLLLLLLQSYYNTGFSPRNYLFKARSHFPFEPIHRKLQNTIITTAATKIPPKNIYLSTLPQQTTGRISFPT